MATTLKVNIAQLRKTAQSMASKAAEYRKEVEGAKTTVETLCDPKIWQDSNEETFKNAFDEDQEALGKFVKFFELAAEKASEAADRYEKLRATMESIIAESLG